MTGPEGAPSVPIRPDEQAVAEALRWFRGNPSSLDLLAGSTWSNPVMRHAATIVRAVVAAAPDGLRPSSRSTAAALRLIAWLDEHPGSVAMDIRMVLADRSRGWNAYRRAALAGARPAVESDWTGAATGYEPMSHLDSPAASSLPTGTAQQPDSDGGGTGEGTAETCTEWRITTPKGVQTTVTGEGNPPVFEIWSRQGYRIESRQVTTTRTVTPWKAEQR